MERAGLDVLRISLPCFPLKVLTSGPSAASSTSSWLDCHLSGLGKRCLASLWGVGVGLGWGPGCAGRWSFLEANGPSWVTGGFFHSNEYLIFQKIIKLEYDFPEKFFPKARDLVEKLLVSLRWCQLQSLSLTSGLDSFGFLVVFCAQLLRPLGGQ